MYMEIKKKRKRTEGRETGILLINLSRLMAGHKFRVNKTKIVGLEGWGQKVGGFLAIV